jgi:putative tryptophan/tyrosine transport system substrate-binding protein
VRFNSLRRRDFIAYVCGAAAAWPLAARAQQPAMPVIGFLRSTTANGSSHLVAAVLQGLKEGGFVAGRNVAIQYRRADDQNDRLPALAGDPVRRQVTVTVAAGIPAAVAAKAATTTIPIVFEIGADPVEIGLVAGLRRPGNLTGVTTLNVELEQKRLELLHEVLPRRAALPSWSHQCGASVDRHADCGSHIGAATPGSACKHRTRFRYGHRVLGPNSSSRARDR